MEIKQVKKEIIEKADALIAQMTLEEKAAQMMQIPYSVVGRAKALEWAEKGAGSFLHVLGDDARELQKTALSHGHGIPVLFGIDAIHGHGLNDHATIFPSQLAMACSWDREAIRKMGRMTAREVAADGLHWTFSPVLCLARDTRWGRVDETFGEDAYLAGELGAAIIHGYQGDDLKEPDSILACAKHYIGYGEAAGARDACDTEMTYRKMKDVFLPPFRKAVEAGCATIMTAYGSIDGEPFTVSHKALKEILRDELEFDGFVVTDWDNVNSLVMNQHVAENVAEASRLAAEAGNDMIMTSEEFYESVISLVRSGKMEESVLDNAVRHILCIKEEMGLFENPEKKVSREWIGCREHLLYEEKLADECVVLLKNKAVLPITAKMKRIAVIGPNADDIRAQYGDWTYFSHPDPDPEHEPMRPYTTLLEGIREDAGSDIQITFCKGCSVLQDDADDPGDAVKAAVASDIIVYVIGDEISQTGEAKDRADLSLSGRQNELFRALKKTGKKIISILLSSKPLCVEEIAEGSDAFLVAFNGGMFGGKAAADILFGRVNPSGKLPVSFPRHSGQLPVYYNSLPGWHDGKYMDMPADPLFSFGEGISYSIFRYGNLKILYSEISEKIWTVSIDIRNCSEIDGEEIVQLYFRDVVSSVMTPVKQLIRFERVRLQAGEKKTVCFTLRQEDFSFVNREEKRITEPGEIELMAGSSSRDEDLLKQSISIDGRS
jgi:beta-glucosidase